MKIFLVFLVNSKPHNQTLAAHTFNHNSRIMMQSWAQKWNNWAEKILNRAQADIQAFYRRDQPGREHLKIEFTWFIQRSCLCENGFWSVSSLWYSSFPTISSSEILLNTNQNSCISHLRTPWWILSLYIRSVQGTASTVQEQLDSDIKSSTILRSSNNMKINLRKGNIL